MAAIKTPAVAPGTSHRFSFWKFTAIIENGNMSSCKIMIHKVSPVFYRVYPDVEKMMRSTRGNDLH
jgi:hypothetical protein